MMLEDFLDSLGHKVRGTCDTVQGALDEVEKGGFDLAILDVNLKGENVWPVATQAAREERAVRHRHRRPRRSAAARVQRCPGDREALYGRSGHSGDRSRVGGLDGGLAVAAIAAVQRSSLPCSISKSQLIFPDPCGAGRRSFAAGRGTLVGRDLGRGETRRCSTSRRASRVEIEDPDPRLRRQCLERAGRRGISPRAISRRGGRRLPLSRLRAVDGIAVGRSAHRRRSAGLRFRGQTIEAANASWLSASASEAGSPRSSLAAGSSMG